LASLWISGGGPSDGFPVGPPNPRPRGHVLKQSTFPALKQLAIAGEKSQETGSFLHGKQARGKLANIVPPPAHFFFAALRLARYVAGDSAICIPPFVSADPTTYSQGYASSRHTSAPQISSTLLFEADLR